MNNTKYIQTLDVLNKRFKYITEREKYGFADTWVLHSDEVVDNFKTDSKLSIPIQIKYLETLRHAIYFIAKNRQLANKQVIAYDTYNDYLSTLPNNDN
jgi:hypothetical protein